MYKKTLQILFLTSASLFLTGFADIHETFTFRSDDTVLVQTRVATTASRSAIGGGQQPICDPGEEPFRMGGTVRSYNDGSDHICEYTKEITLDDFTTRINPAGIESNDIGLSIVETTDGYRLQVRLTLAGLMPEPIEDEFFGTSALIENMIAELTAGRAMTMTVVAPAIIATDGTMNEEATVATISIPIATLIDPEVGPVTRFIEFRTKRRSFWQRIFQ